MAQKKSGFSWAWVFLFLILGLFVSLIIFLDQKIVENIAPVETTDTSQPVDDKPRIDFYSILPDRVVDIPISEKDQQAIENPSINKTAGEATILQVGSFQSVTEADSMKAQLALLGLEAKIESAEVNSSIWHRVVLGPYRNNGKLSRTKNLLIENRIEFMQRVNQP
ncbi:MAG: SPOR domain-containing protein [Gammaproteobacteria bacterium]